MFESALMDGYEEKTTSFAEAHPLAGYTSRTRDSAPLYLVFVHALLVSPTILEFYLRAMVINGILLVGRYT